MDICIFLCELFFANIKVLAPSSFDPIGFFFSKYVYLNPTLLLSAISWNHIPTHVIVLVIQLMFIT